MLQVQQVCPPAQAEQINYLLKGLVTLPASAGRRRTAATNVMVVLWLLFFKNWQFDPKTSRRRSYCERLQAGGGDLLQL